MSSGKKEKKGAGTPPVFCKRARKRLMPKELAGCSSLRCAEEWENRGVNFWLLLQGRGTAKQERNREADTDSTGLAGSRGKGVLPSSSAIKNNPSITYSY